MAKQDTPLRDRSIFHIEDASAAINRDGKILNIKLNYVKNILCLMSDGTVKNIVIPYLDNEYLDALSDFMYEKRVFGNSVEYGWTSKSCGWNFVGTEGSIDGQFTKGEDLILRPKIINYSVEILTWYHQERNRLLGRWKMLDRESAVE